MTLSHIWRDYNLYGLSPVVSNLPWNGVTHILDVFAGIRPDGTVDLDMLVPGMAARAPNLIAAAHSRDVKVLLCIGGVATQNSDMNLFNKASENAWNVASNIVQVVNTLGYDGVAMDWELSITPTVQTHVVLAELLRCLRIQLAPPKLLTCNAGAHPLDAALWGQNGAVRYLDRLHIMPLNMGYHSVGRSYHHTALFGGEAFEETAPAMSVDGTINLYLSKGIPAKIMNVLLAAYGWHFKSSPGPHNIIGSIANDVAEIPYSTIAALPDYNNWTWDHFSRVPQLIHNDGSWHSFDNIPSIEDKTHYVIERGLGGIDFHHIGSDQQGTFPLWNAVQNAFFNSEVKARPAVVVEVDRGSLTRLSNWTQYPHDFRGSIHGNIFPYLDCYVVDLNETILYYAGQIPVVNGRWHATFPPTQFAPGVYRFYVFGAGNVMLAKPNFVVF